MGAKPTRWVLYPLYPETIFFCVTFMSNDSKPYNIRFRESYWHYGSDTSCDSDTFKPGGSCRASNITNQFKLLKYIKKVIIRYNWDRNPWQTTLEEKGQSSVRASWPQWLSWRVEEIPGITNENWTGETALGVPVCWSIYSLEDQKCPTYQERFFLIL